MRHFYSVKYLFVSRQDAVNLLSDYLKDLTENLNDGTSDVVNRMEEMVADLLSQALNFPSFIEYEDEDVELSKKISELWWVTPTHLCARFDIQVVTWLSQVENIF